MQMMDYFDAADVAPASALTDEQLSTTSDFIGVHTWKGMDIRSRLCVRGLTQWIKDLDDTFASTPVLMILRLLLFWTQYAMEHLHI